MTCAAYEKRKMIITIAASVQRQQTAALAVTASYALLELSKHGPCPVQ